MTDAPRWPIKIERGQVWAFQGRLYRVDFTRRSNVQVTDLLTRRTRLVDRKEFEERWKFQRGVPQRREPPDQTG